MIQIGRGCGKRSSADFSSALGVSEVDKFCAWNGENRLPAEKCPNFSGFSDIRTLTFGTGFAKLISVFSDGGKRF